MGIINLLDTEISNKIAAGEVVERPASVVKELVENSIDAGATKITVEIKNGGNTYIKVSDNGAGMEKDDAAVAFLRHATSKIKTEDDLNAIYTLGFRGEALSSIGAVAMVDLYTKRKCDEYGTHTVCEGGEIVSSEDAGIADGTTFIVKNLFYNVPARMKFLKKDATEAGYIQDIMSRFILAHPEISFKLISSQKQVLYSAGDDNPKNAVYAVYGKDYATAMLEVDFKSEYVTVSGLVGKGTTARPNRNYQSFFVNKRYIKSPLIMRAVEEAYKNQIMIGKFPTAVLNIELNPSMVDINVHPTKLEVKFSNESEVYRAVYNAVKEALYKIPDIPEIKRTEKTQKQNEEEKKPLFVPDKVVKDGQIEITKINTEPEKKQEVKKDIFSYSVPQSHNVASPKMFDYFSNDEKPKTQIIKPEEKISDEKKGSEFTKESEQKKENDIPPVTEKPLDVKKEEAKAEKVIIPSGEEKEEQKTVSDIEFKLVGQIFDTYIIIERNGEMQIIDQHAAHERLNYEKLLAELENNSVYSQMILVPEIVSLTSSEMSVFEQNIDFITSIGFDAEIFDSNSVIIRAVPGNADEDITGLFVEILSQLDEFKREIISEKRQRLLYTIACKAAVNANCKLSETEQKNIVKKVLALENINTCPHGRPIIITMTKKELEKEFKRIV